MTDSSLITTVMYSLEDRECCTAGNKEAWAISECREAFCEAQPLDQAFEDESAEKRARAKSPRQEEESYLWSTCYVPSSLHGTQCYFMLRVSKILECEKKQRE